MIDLRQEIINYLDQIFGIPVRGEMTPQNFTPPCFFVKELEGQEQKRMGPFHDSTHHFDIHYFPELEAKRPNHECGKMKQALTEKFRLFEPLKLWPENVSGETIDEVLHFFVSFKLRYQWVEPEGEPFGEMDLRSDIKNV